MVLADFDYLKQDDNNLSVYLFGSRLYGTYNNNSDFDFIIVQKELKKYSDINIHCFTIETFEKAVMSGDISCLEVIFSSPEYVLKSEYIFPYNKIKEIDYESFRRNISMLTSNSWVKGKKKLIVVGDYDLNIGLKSIFHSVRILDYAIQIKTFNTIIDYTRMNWFYYELISLSLKYERQELWDVINEKYRSLYNSLASKLRELIPIDKTSSREVDLKNILKLHNVYSADLFNDIKKIL